MTSVELKITQECKEKNRDFDFIKVELVDLFEVCNDFRSFTSKSIFAQSWPFSCVLRCHI